MCRVFWVYFTECTLLLSCLARSQPGDWHPYHRPACDRNWRFGEPVLGSLPPQREPAHHLRRRHVSPLGDHGLSARLRHHGLCWQVWEHQHCKFGEEKSWLECQRKSKLEYTMKCTFYRTDKLKKCIFNFLRCVFPPTPATMWMKTPQGTKLYGTEASWMEHHRR